jgi:hypothetical protein
MLGNLDCCDCGSLLREYGVAVDGLIQASKALASVSGSMERDIFSVLWERCETARDRCVGLRRLYVLHLSGHNS